MSEPVDLMGVVRDKERAEGIDFEKDVESKFHLVDGTELDKPMAPTPWLCRELRIAPGAPMIFGGAGFSGKTMAAQSLALSVAAGIKAWGQYEIRQGAVLHLDYEQDSLTQRRYKRMARSMHLNLSKIGRSLAVSMIPRWSLSDPGTERALAYLCNNRVMCIIDAFRGAFPLANENDSSSVVVLLNMLARVSKATGCVMLVIAHTRKLGPDADVRASLRGSGAMFDACSTLYMMTGSKGKPARVENVKERHTGRDIPAFGLRYVNVPGPRSEMSDPGEGLDPEWGLDVEYVTPEDMQAQAIRDEASEDSIAMSLERQESLSIRIAELLSRVGEKTPVEIRGFLGGTVAEISAALIGMDRVGALSCEGKGPNATYSVNLDYRGHREPGEDD